MLIAILAERTLSVRLGNRNDSMMVSICDDPIRDGTAQLTAILSQINIAGFVPETQFRLLLFSQLKCYLKKYCYYLFFKICFYLQHYFTFFFLNYFSFYYIFVFKCEIYIKKEKSMNNLIFITNKK